MDWIDEDQNRLSSAVRDWIIQFLIAKEPQQVYREALIAVIHNTWPNNGPGFILLPGLCSQVLGTQPRQIIPLHAAWAVLYIAYYLLDKIEDEETGHALFSCYGIGTVNNLTTGLILHSQRMILEGLVDLKTETNILYEVQTVFNRKALAVCAGQHLDLSSEYPSLDEVWAIAGAKSGEFFSLAGFLGARLATDKLKLIDAVIRFGWRLGMIIQAANDIEGLDIVSETGGDLAQGKITLPVAYAMHVLPPEQRNHLHKLLGEARQNPLAEVEARKQIIEVGALTYLALEIERFRYMAVMDLQQVGTVVDPLLTLLHNTIDTTKYLRLLKSGSNSILSES